MDISFIIVNWNTKDLLRDCLESIIKTVDVLAYEVIVVDNASKDGSVEMLSEQYPQVKAIANSENRGFGAANNQGFAAMKGKYALLINTDAVLTAGAVQKLWAFAEAHPDAAIVCGQLLNADGSKQNSIASFPTLLSLATNTSLLEYLFPSRYPSKRYEHKEPLEVDSAVGACMMIRKKALDEVSFFDERYFFFFEETDMAYAMKKAGWRIYQVPDALTYHLQGQSIGHNSRSRIEFYRSRYQFLRKWKSKAYCGLASMIIFVRLVLTFLLNALGVVATLGLVKNIRQKTGVYLDIILWHFFR
ncbi:MAG TPA: glycosyltransferase family 2 protein, partial [Smithellaceae bacterium]|nr:glycosyltransferase family 2 protein [Smithellaceae bacterium]